MSELKELLDASSLSDLDLARLLKVSVPVIRHWKAGKRPHPIAEKAIIDVLAKTSPDGVTVATLD